MAEERTFHVVGCFECEGNTLLPFYSWDERFTWITGHYKGTGHSGFMLGTENYTVVDGELKAEKRRKKANGSAN